VISPFVRGFKSRGPTSNVRLCLSNMCTGPKVVR